MEKFYYIDEKRYCVENNREKKIIIKKRLKMYKNICSNFKKEGYIAKIGRINLRKLAKCKDAPSAKFYFYPTENGEPVISTFSLLEDDGWKYELALGMLTLDNYTIKRICREKRIPLSPLWFYSGECAQIARSIIGKNDSIIGKNDNIYHSIEKDALIKKSARKKLITRDEINNALDALSASANEVGPPPVRSAMCYSMSPPIPSSMALKCDICNRFSTFEVYNTGFASDSSIREAIYSYRKIAEQFNSSGYKAEYKVLCQNCNNRVHDFFDFGGFRGRFSFWAKEDQEPVVNYPSLSSEDIWKYIMALRFLNGEATTAGQLDTLMERKTDGVGYYKALEEIIGDPHKIDPIPKEKDHSTFFDEDLKELEMLLSGVQSSPKNNNEEISPEEDFDYGDLFLT